MSDAFAINETVDAIRPRNLARTLLLGSLCCVAALMLQTANFGPQRNLSTHRPNMLVRLIDAAQPSQEPSAYDIESGMNSSQLLNRWDTAITEASQRFHIPKAWIRAVMRQESGGRTMLGENKPIVSRAGAVGLMQVLPATYDQMAEQHKLGDDPFDARDNIMAGAAYLRWLHERYGFPKMFAAYNAGPGRVEHGGRLPAETRAYVGGITKTLKSAKSSLDLVKLTRPDGAAMKIDAGQVTAVRAPLPGEYNASVRAVLTLNHHKRQAVRENVTIARAAIRATGGFI
ncbi:MAG TPA: lytic transglycosylase domain-containing protein [Rhizomicrobium sp.]